MDKFEKYVLSRINFCKSMLSISSDAPGVYSYSTVLYTGNELMEREIEILESILHHFNLFVKGESDGTIQE